LRRRYDFYHEYVLKSMKYEWYYSYRTMQQAIHYYTVGHKILHPSHWYINFANLCHTMIIFGTKMDIRISYHLPVWYSLYNWKLRTSLSDLKRRLIENVVKHSAKYHWSGDWSCCCISVNNLLRNLHYSSLICFTIFNQSWVLKF